MLPISLAVSGGLPGTPSPEGGRQTRPDYFNAYASGMGIVPRRGWDLRTDELLKRSALNPIEGLGFFLATIPQRLLAVVLEAHPLAAQARSNDLTLAFAPGDTHLVAVSQDGTGGEKIDSAGTSLLDALWDRLPPETGGLSGLQAAMYDQVCAFGAAFVEGVPGPRGSGLSDIPTADPLTARFRDALDAGGHYLGRVLEQNQSGEWIGLDRSTVFFVPFHGTRDNPYGKPKRSAALSEILRDYAGEGKLDKVLSRVALPRISVGFALEQATQYALDNKETLLQGQGPGGRDLLPAEWAIEQFMAVGKKMAEQKDDDVFVRFKGAEATVLSGADGLKSLEGTFEMRRLRLVSALDQLPGMLGITDGGTQAYTVAQYKLQQKKLEYIRAFVNRVLEMLGTLHLRLLGLNLTARADVEPMSPVDAVADQQARQLEIANELTLFDNGLISSSDLAVNLTGSSVVDADKLAARGKPASSPLPPPPAADDSGKPLGDPMPAPPALPQPQPSK